MTEKQIRAIARAAHEANRSWCEIIGDPSQASWDDAEEWQKKSAIEGVRYHVRNPGTTPEGSHQSWLDGKKADGWKYGPVKDPVKKEHPCFVPYKELPSEQKQKDWIFTTIFKALSSGA